VPAYRAIDHYIALKTTGEISDNWYFKDHVYTELGYELVGDTVILPPPPPPPFLQRRRLG